MSDFVYMADPATREVTRRHRDGAAFAAFGQPHRLAFWSRHPNVDRIAEGDGTSDGEIEVRVWLKDGFASERTETPLGVRPGDDPDYEFAGPGLMGDAFWEHHPDVAYAEVLNVLGNDSLDQDAWRVAIWLKDA
jgi:hypothetical protein